MMAPASFLALAGDILPPRLSTWRNEIAAACLAYAIDPLLVAAIMDRESLGGTALVPQGARGTGDHGHGRGLMQIDDRAHEFVQYRDDAGRFLWQDPAFNVLYAVRLLDRNIMQLGGDMPAGVAAYNCGAGRVRKALSALAPATPYLERLAALDKLTANGDYVTDVLRRRITFLSRIPNPA
jgi:soluble lytic murein transglycosylase-like protein